jgi:hypothetical protein
MDQPGLDHRHRDKAGEISRKHGDTLVITLRRIYGRSFAEGEVDTATRAGALHDLDEPSLSNLLHDHHQDALDSKIAGNSLSSGGS